MDTDKSDLPLISVIVPIYNMEKYLAKCIESILGQTYAKLEIILIDDGSTDQSGAICDSYADRDVRIKVIHKINGGLSEARNYGIETSTGEYFSFIDSDDYVSCYFVECLYQALKSQNTEIATVTHGARFWNEEYQEVHFTEKSGDWCSVAMPVEKVLESILYQNTPTGIPWRLYKRNIFEGICFPVGYLYEDLATSYKLFMKVDKVAVTEATLYAYRLRSDSIIRKGFSQEKMIVVPITRELFHDICKYNPDLRRAAASRAFAAIFSVYLQVPFEKKDFINLLWKEMLRYRKQVLFNLSRKMRYKNRIGAVCSLFGKYVAYYIGRKYGQKGTMSK